MSPATLVPPDLLRCRSDSASIPFESTAEVTRIGEIVGQDRAVDAVRFGVAIRSHGYSLALGPHGTGKQTLLRMFSTVRLLPSLRPRRASSDSAKRCVFGRASNRVKIVEQDI
jgi:hypothetical protein